MKNFLLGVDIGTTSTKAVLFDRKGQVVSQHAVEYPLHTPVPGAAEQDPEEIYAAVKVSIREAVNKSGINKEELLLISFSSAMHSLIAMDQHDQALTKSITWADQRSEPWAKKLKEEWNGHDIYLRTGTPIHPMSPLAKIIWLKEEHPRIFEQTSKFISIKEYVFHRLFGAYIVDHSIASATGMLHLKQLDWDEEALRVAGITPDKLSTLVSTTHTINGLSDELAAELGIDPDVPFVIGANDGVLSNLGVDAIQPGVVALTIGTSGAIRTVTDQPVTDIKGRIFCYALTENHWVIGGPVNNGGMVMRWLRDELCREEVEEAKRIGADPYDLITEKLAKVKAGAEGLVFHPYLAGERAPLWNANARGSFFGLGMHHKKEHMMRAVLEGINLNIYTVLLALEEIIGIPEKIHATGGFAKSAVWRQMLADVFNQEVQIPESVESSCLGAVVLGLYALGEIDDLTVVSDMVGTTESHKPDQEQVKIYTELIPIYLRLSRLFEEDYEAIVQFQQKYSS
ncbi:gluconokinase [Aquibacillus koreensis]|uniref:Gluconokinase n=1 Tax=Aquibacillus koreensis TaxID=279446 RepID=A0A9X3WJE1_9BACI|nr:gluconokinase [Aquibacillus koreensis]MCT2536491.1 gluconokinase [Aquibacillus koreensis]MDC3419421.1 gluconokinase [Aquibacillus koreensis]